MNIINLTPHAINICTEEGLVVKTIKPSGKVARLTATTKEVSQLDGISITETVFGETVGLPPFFFCEGNCRGEYDEGGFACTSYLGDGVCALKPYYIVSRLIMSANTNRVDLLVPNEVVRDTNGNIVGCKSLARN